MSTLIIRKIYCYISHDTNTTNQSLLAGTGWKKPHNNEPFNKQLLLAGWLKTHRRHFSGLYGNLHTHNFYFPNTFLYMHSRILEVMIMNQL